MVRVTTRHIALVFGMRVQHGKGYHKAYSLDIWYEGSAWFVCLFDLILYVPSTIFHLNREGTSWVEPVLS